MIGALIFAPQKPLTDRSRIEQLERENKRLRDLNEAMKAAMEAHGLPTP